MSAAKKRGLGRGLDALLGSLEPESVEATEGGVGSAKSQEAMDESLRQLKALGYL